MPIQGLDRKEQNLHAKKIALVKILWRNHSKQEAMWEGEEKMCTKYP